MGMKIGMMGGRPGKGQSSLFITPKGWRKCSGAKLRIPHIVPFDVLAGDPMRTKTSRRYKRFY